MNEKFTNWIASLRAKGKTDKEIGIILAGITKSAGTDLYKAIMLTLTDEEMTEVEKIRDDNLAMAKIDEFFKMRTGMTLNEFTNEAQSIYLKSLKLI